MSDTEESTEAERLSQIRRDAFRIANPLINRHGAAGLADDVKVLCKCVLADDALRDRIVTITDEAFGPFPVQSAEDSLSAIERGIFEQRQLIEASIRQWEALVANAAQVCAHCQQPHPVVDGVMAHVRECPKNPMVQRITALEQALRDAMDKIAEMATVFMPLGVDVKGYIAAAQEPFRAVLDGGAP